MLQESRYPNSKHIGLIGDRSRGACQSWRVFFSIYKYGANMKASEKHQHHHQKANALE